MSKKILFILLLLFVSFTFAKSIEMKKVDDKIKPIDVSKFKIEKNKDDKFSFKNGAGKGFDLEIFDGIKKVSKYDVLSYENKSFVKKMPSNYETGMRFAFNVTDGKNRSYYEFIVTLDENSTLLKHDETAVKYFDSYAVGSFDGTPIQITKYKLIDFRDILRKNKGATTELVRTSNNSYTLRMWNVTDLDPTITDVFTSELLGTYNQTEWDSTNNDLRLEDDALLIIKGDAPNETDLSHSAHVASIDKYHTQADQDGSEAWVSAQNGNGLKFDGVNAKVDLGQQSQYDFDTTTNFTVCFWVYPESTTTQESIIDAGNTLPRWEIDFLSGTEYTIHANTGAGPLTLTHNVDLSGAWHHICTVWDRTANVTGYVDGSQVITGSLASIGNLTTGQNICMGTNADLGFYLDAIMDDVLIYNCTLNSSEILAMNNTAGYTGTCADGSNGIVGHWALNESSGDSALDSSSYVNNASLSGYERPSWNYTAGQYLGSYKFDGTDDYIDITDSNILDFDTNLDFTVSYWVKYNALNATQRLMGNYLGSPRGGFTIDTTNGKPRWYTRQGAADDYVITSNTAMVTTNWNLVTFSVDRDDNVTIYINGIEASSTVANNISGLTSNISSTGSFLIGKRSDETGDNFNGTIDDIFIINKTLSAAEVLALYSGDNATVNYIPKYYETSNFTRLAGQNRMGYNISVDNVTMYGLFDNNTNIIRGVDTIPDLIGWWTLDNTTDDLNKTYNGTGNNDPVYSPQGLNGSYYFGGTYGQEWIDINSDLFNGTTANTMCAWIKFQENPSDGSPTARKIFGSIGGGSVGIKFTENTNTFSFNYRNQSVDQVDVSVSFDDEDPENHKWMHWCMKIDLGTDGIAYVYKNGQLLDQSGTSLQGTLNSPDLCIGGDGQGRYFRGWIDEAIMFNRSLGDGEILQLYRDGGSKLEIETRTSNDSITWSNWFTADALNLQTGVAALNSSMPAGRFVDYRFLFDSTTDEEFTALIDNVTFGYGANNPPTHTQPIINTTYLTNTSTENISVYNQTTEDGNGDSIRNIIVWSKNGLNTTLIKLPFEGNSGNEATQTLDYSGHNLHANVSGATWNIVGGYTGNFGAYEFDGDDDYLVADSMTLQFDTGLDFAVLFWLKINTDTGASDRIAGTTSSVPSEGWSIDMPNNKIRFFTQLAGSSDYIATADTAINVSEWTHIGVVVDRDDNVTFYYNGVLQPATIQRPENLTNNLSSSDSLYIGRLSTDASNYLNGSLDEFMIIDGTMSAEQILSVAQNSSDIVSQETTLGDTWTACITPNDGYENGETNCSNTITILSPLQFVSPTPPDLIVLPDVNPIEIWMNSSTPMDTNCTISVSGVNYTGYLENGNISCYYNFTTPSHNFVYELSGWANISGIERQVDVNRTFTWVNSTLCIETLDVFGLTQNTSYWLNPTDNYLYVAAENVTINNTCLADLTDAIFHIKDDIADNNYSDFLVTINATTMQNESNVGFRIPINASTDSDIGEFDVFSYRTNNRYNFSTSYTRNVDALQVNFTNPNADFFSLYLCTQSGCEPNSTFYSAQTFNSTSDNVTRLENSTFSGDFSYVLSSENQAGTGGSSGLPAQSIIQTTTETIGNITGTTIKETTKQAENICTNPFVVLGGLILLAIAIRRKQMKGRVF